MFKINRSRGTALGLAFVVTLSLLAGLDQLATRQHAATDIARAGDAGMLWLARASSTPCLRAA